MLRVFLVVSGACLGMSTVSLSAAEQKDIVGTSSMIVPQEIGGAATLINFEGIKNVVREGLGIVDETIVSRGVNLYFLGLVEGVQQMSGRLADGARDIFTDIGRIGGETVAQQRDIQELAQRVREVEQLLLAQTDRLGTLSGRYDGLEVGSLGQVAMYTTVQQQIHELGIRINTIENAMHLTNQQINELGPIVALNNFFRQLTPDLMLDRRVLFSVLIFVACADAWITFGAKKSPLHGKLLLMPFKSMVGAMKWPLVAAFLTRTAWILDSEGLQAALVPKYDDIRSLVQWVNRQSREHKIALLIFLSLPSYQYSLTLKKLLIEQIAHLTREYWKRAASINECLSKNSSVKLP